MYIYDPGTLREDGTFLFYMVLIDPEITNEISQGFLSNIKNPYFPGSWMLDSAKNSKLGSSSLPQNI